MELGMDLRAACTTASRTFRPCAMPPRFTAAQIADVRHPTREFSVGSGVKRPANGCFTSATDCSIADVHRVALEKR